MKKMKKKYRWILAILLIILIIVILFFMIVLYNAYHHYGHHFPVREFVDNQKNEPYSQNIPLHEMDFEVYFQYFCNTVAAGKNEFITYMIELPCDIDYYVRKEDSVPELTLKKGTEVCVFLSDKPTLYLSAGYGMKCWPDYEEEWRYGCPFITEDIPYVITEHPMYYVKSSQLRKVAWAYYQTNKKYMNNLWPWDFPKRITEDIDEELYRAGAFCPERWKKWKK